MQIVLLFRQATKRPRSLIKIRGLFFYLFALSTKSTSPQGVVDVADCTTVLIQFKPSAALVLATVEVAPLV